MSSTSFARGELEQHGSWARNGWYSTWSANTGATSSACSSRPAGKFDTPMLRDPPVLAQPVERVQRLLERHLRVRPVQEQQVDVVDAEPLERVLGGALDLVGGRRRRPDLRREEDLVPRHAARPRSRARPRARSRRRAPCRSAGSRAPARPGRRRSRRARSPARCRIRGAESSPPGRRSSGLHSSWSESLSHCYAWQPPGRLAQLGERRLDKAEVTGSSPVSPIKSRSLHSPASPSKTAS